MKRQLTILGDYNPAWETHRATDAAIGHARQATGIPVVARWCATAEIGPAVLAESAGLWIATGAPYRDRAKVLDAIRHAREQGVPCLGTCQRFQHVMLEFARAFLRLPDPGHQEYEPTAPRPFIASLDCSLRERELEVRIEPDSLAGRSYGVGTAAERYFCSYGIHPDHAPAVRNGPIRVSGVDAAGEIRIVEYPGHPFMLATLFVPQARSTAEAPHPLVAAFLRAMGGNPGEGTRTPSNLDSPTTG